MDPDSLLTLIFGLGGAGIGAVLRWRALWIARRLYRVPGWRGQSVADVASTIRVSSWVLIAMGVIYSTLGVLGIEAPSLH